MAAAYTSRFAQGGAYSTCCVADNGLGSVGGIVLLSLAVAVAFGLSGAYLLRLSAEEQKPEGGFVVGGSCSSTDYRLRNRFYQGILVQDDSPSSIGDKGGFDKTV